MCSNRNTHTNGFHTITIKTETRCWVPSTELFCANIDPTSDEAGNCVDGSPTQHFKGVSLFFSVGLTALAFVAAFITFIIMIFFEWRRRKLNSRLQGKTLYIETARKKKSRHKIIFTAAHLLVLFVSNFKDFSRLFFTSTEDRTCFAMVFIGTVLTTLNGFFNAIIYLYVRKPQVEENNNSLLLAKHSIRKSIRSIENVTYVTGGYKPKSKQTIGTLSKSLSTDAGACPNITNFGIFVGSDDEEDDDMESGTSFMKPLNDRDLNRASLISSETALTKENSAVLSVCGGALDEVSEAGEDEDSSEMT